jgi:hypothetical protein
MTRRRLLIDDCMRAIGALIGGIFTSTALRNRGAPDIRAAVKKDMDFYIHIWTIQESFHPVILAHVQKLVNKLLNDIDLILRETDRISTLFPGAVTDPKEAAIAVTSTVKRFKKLADDINKRKNQS